MEGGHVRSLPEFSKISECEKLLRDFLIFLKFFHSECEGACVHRTNVHSWLSLKCTADAFKLAKPHSLSLRSQSNRQEARLSIEKNFTKIHQ